MPNFVRYLIKRCLIMVATIIALSFVVFASQEINSEAVAIKALGQYSTETQRQQWLEENGYDEIFLIRYVRWGWRFVQGDFGYSYRYKRPVAEVLAPRLANTAILALSVMLLLAPLSVLAGVIAGIKIGKTADNIVSITAILSTSIPEFAGAAFFSAVFVYWLDWLPATSTMSSGVNLQELALPVLVLVFYAWGYVTRITRASVSDIWRSPYIRAAKLKGLSEPRVVIVHLLKNALTTPITVLLLQFPWLLSGVLVVEYFFAYKGFGIVLLEAALNQDIFLLEACAVVAAIVVVVTQFIGDLLYALLNPRYTLS